ncbi:MAG: hypothetical protein AABM29_01940 [Actinomycetota bacterium]
MGRRAQIPIGLLVGGLVALGACAPAAAQGPQKAYRGLSPFNCDLQYVGTGVTFPKPGAEPFCVEFDKTQQNVSDFGIFDFFANEPARVAAASPKCFYFQRDHWTGSFVQGTDPEFWHWDGSYFFDKSNGSGGANLANFRSGGQALNAAPYAPAEFQPFLAPGGGGGGYAEGEVESDPSCAKLVDTPSERAQVYYHEMEAGKVFRRRITPLRLGERSGALHHDQGPAHEVLNGTERFNVKGGGQLRIAFRGGVAARASADSDTVAAILTTSSKHFRGRVSPGVTAKKAKRKLKARFRFRARAYRVFEAKRKPGTRLFLGVRRRSLEWLAVVDPKQLRKRRAVKRTLTRLGRTGKGGRIDSIGMPW